MSARAQQGRGLPPGLLLVVALLAAWGAWFIHRTSFLVSGERVFCLFDDAMISMTYARNWVEGHGLNWAREGTPVEGFSCPLWTFYMALLQLLPVPLRLQSLLVQTTSLLLLLANVVAVHRLVRRHFAGEGGAGHALPAAILTASYYPLALWSLEGMETGLQTLLVTLSVSLTLDVALDARRREPALFALLCAALLLRLDMAIVVAAVCAFLLVSGGLARDRLRRWLLGCGALAATLLAYQTFRVLYFHDWLPNTYYLKMTGLPASLRMLRGWIVFRDFLAIAWVPLALALLGGAALARRRPAFALATAIVALQLGYSVYVGGDAWEWSNVGANRFQVIVMPLVFALLTGLLNTALDAARRRKPALRLGPSDLWVCLPAVLVCAVLANGLLGVDRADERRRNLLVLDLPLHVDQHRETLLKLREVQRHFAPQARMLTVLAGIPAYFSDFRMADTLGYNDRHIARLPHVHRLRVLDPSGIFKPGHDKLSYAWSLGQLRPDFVFQTFWLGPREPELMAWYGYERRFGVWVRRDSPYVLPEPGP